jgi:hypothetical protein
MKKVILAVLALSLMFSVIPAMAETGSQAPALQAVSQLSTPPVMAKTSSQAPALQAVSQLSTVVPMTDQQLASVEGAAFFSFFTFQSNYSEIEQTSACGFFASCNQGAIVTQVNIN